MENRENGWNEAGRSSCIVLQDEKNRDVYFEFLDLILYGGEEYVVLMPVGSRDGEAVILRVAETDEYADVSEYESVEDEQVLEAVFSIFKGRFQDEFEFE